MRTDPPLGTAELRRGLCNRSLEPTPPVAFQVARVGEGDVLVREQQDVVLEDDEQVTDLLPLTLPHVLVTERRRKAPEREKGAATECVEVALGGRHPFSSNHGYPWRCAQFFSDEERTFQG